MTTATSALARTQVRKRFTQAEVDRCVRSVLARCDLTYVDGYLVQWAADVCPGRVIMRRFPVDATQSRTGELGIVDRANSDRSRIYAAPAHADWAASVEAVIKRFAARIARGAEPA